LREWPSRGTGRQFLRERRKRRDAESFRSRRFVLTSGLETFRCYETSSPRRTRTCNTLVNRQQGESTTTDSLSTCGDTSARVLAAGRCLWPVSARLRALRPAVRPSCPHLPPLRRGAVRGARPRQMRWPGGSDLLPSAPICCERSITASPARTPPHDDRADAFALACAARTSRKLQFWGALRKRSFVAAVVGSPERSE
jgi:hypothetical protein